MNNDVLEWVEKAALENLRNHLHTTDILAKEATTTLTILIAAMSGAFAYAVGQGPYATVSALLTGYLLFLCAVLTLTCLRIDEVPSPTNEPDNLMQDGYTLEQLRKAELKNIQGRINTAALRNNKTAGWLNGIRLGAISAPIFFVLAFVVASRAGWA